MASSAQIQTTDSPREEALSALVHGVDAVLAVVGLVMLLVRTGMTGEPLRIISAGVFGLCMLAVYFSSTLLHAVRVPRARRVRLECDHIAIHLLIAGTHTPRMPTTVGGAWRWTLFGLVWARAAVGIALRIVTRGQRPLLAVGVHIAMGWIGVIG